MAEYRRAKCGRKVTLILTHVQKWVRYECLTHVECIFLVVNLFGEVDVKATLSNLLIVYSLLLSLFGLLLEDLDIPLVSLEVWKLLSFYLTVKLQFGDDGFINQISLLSWGCVWDLMYLWSKGRLDSFSVHFVIQTPLSRFRIIGRYLLTRIYVCSVTWTPSWRIVNTFAVQGFKMNRLLCALHLCSLTLSK